MYSKLSVRLSHFFGELIKCYITLLYNFNLSLTACQAYVVLESVGEFIQLAQYLLFTAQPPNKIWGSFKPISFETL